jgi:hypothetical protein
MLQRPFASIHNACCFLSQSQPPPAVRSILDYQEWGIPHENSAESEEAKSTAEVAALKLGREWNDFDQKVQSILYAMKGQSDANLYEHCVGMAESVKADLEVVLDRFSSEVEQLVEASPGELKACETQEKEPLRSRKGKASALPCEAQKYIYVMMGIRAGARSFRMGHVLQYHSSWSPWGLPQRWNKRALCKLRKLRKI